MINALLEVFMYIAIVFGGAIVMSAVGVGALLGFDKIREKWRKKANGKEKQHD